MKFAAGYDGARSSEKRIGADVPQNLLENVQRPKIASQFHCRSDAPVPSAVLSGPKDFSAKALEYAKQRAAECTKDFTGMTLEEAKAYLYRLALEGMAISKKMASEDRNYETPEEQARFREIATESFALAEVHNL